MNELKSIVFSRQDDLISALVLQSDFKGYELIYDELEDKISEAFFVNASGYRAVHTVISLEELPILLQIKVKKFIKLNYGIQ